MTSTNQFNSLIFCAQCGSLLDLPADDDVILCSGCGRVEEASGAFKFFWAAPPGALPSRCSPSRTTLGELSQRM